MSIITLYILFQNTMTFQWTQCTICQDSILFGYECDSAIKKHMTCRDCIFGMAVRRSSYESFSYSQTFLDGIQNMPKCPMCATPKEGGTSYQECTQYNNQAAERGLPCDFYAESGIRGATQCELIFHSHEDRNEHIQSCDQFNKVRYLRLIPHMKRVLVDLTKITQNKKS